MRSRYSTRYVYNHTRSKKQRWTSDALPKVCQPKVLFFENVITVTHKQGKDNRVEPLINTVASDMHKLGYLFEYQVLNAQDYILPQRRNRCWATAVLETGSVSKDEYKKAMDVATMYMSSGTRFKPEHFLERNGKGRGWPSAGSSLARLIRDARHKDGHARNEMPSIRHFLL